MPHPSGFFRVASSDQAARRLPPGCFFVQFLKNDRKPDRKLVNRSLWFPFARGHMSICARLIGARLVLVHLIGKTKPTVSHVAGARLVVVRIEWIMFI